VSSVGASSGGSVPASSGDAGSGFVNWWKDLFGGGSSTASSSADDLPYSEEHQQVPPGEDSGDSIPVPSSTGNGMALVPRSEVMRHEQDRPVGELARRGHLGKLSQKDAIDRKKKVLLEIKNDLANCLAAQTNNQWTGGDCGQFLTHITQRLVAYNGEVLENYGADADELFIDMNMLDPYRKKDQEFLAAGQSQVAIYVAGPPVGNSSVIDLTEPLTMGMAWIENFPYKLLATQAQLEKVVKNGATPSGFIKLVFGKLGINDCEDIPDGQKIYKEQCIQLRANAKKIIDNIRDHMNTGAPLQIGEPMSPSEAPPYTASNDLSSNDSLSPAKVLLLGAAEADESAQEGLPEFSAEQGEESEAVLIPYTGASRYLNELPEPRDLHQPSIGQSRSPAAFARKVLSAPTPPHVLSHRRRHDRPRPKREQEQWERREGLE